jgi:integrase
MSIYKRKNTWWIQVTLADGTRIQKTSGSQIKEEAQELHDKIKSEAWQQKKLGTKPKYSWQAVVVRWLQEHESKKSLKDDKGHLRWLDQHLNHKMLDDINKSVIEQLKKEKLKTGVSNATVNRMLALIRSILKSAKDDWEWIDNIPSIKLLPEPLDRVRWLSQEEAERLLSELPTHLQAMARFTLATGLRESNVTGLQWSQLDLQRRCAWIHADQAKAAKAISVPLGDDAMAVINDELGKHETYVFTYEGKQIRRANNRAWQKALRRAGINDFRWHDLRHTWASWHIQNNTPIPILKELGGWSDSKMVMRYAHLSSEHLREYGNNSNFNRKNRGLVSVK